MGQPAQADVRFRSAELLWVFAVASQFWLGMKLPSRSQYATSFRKTVLVTCLVLFITGFVSTIVLDTYFLENRPREAIAAEGKVYPRYVKSSYGATVYLTYSEKILSDWLFPLSIVIVTIGIALNTQWELLAPYKKSKSIALKRKDGD